MENENYVRLDNGQPVGLDLKTKSKNENYGEEKRWSASWPGS